MSSLSVTAPALDARGMSPYLPIQRFSASKIHTIQDWQETGTGNIKELTELLDQTTVLMNSAKDTVERHSSCIASNRATLKNIIERTKIQADGQPELALKIEQAEKNTAEMRRKIIEVKKAGCHALVAAGTLGASIALRTMPASPRSEQHAPHSSRQPSNNNAPAPLSETRAQDRPPNIDPPQQMRSGSILVTDMSPNASGSSIWPSQSEADWNRLVHEAQQQNGGVGGAITPWMPINQMQRSTGTLPNLRLGSTTKLCGYGDPEPNYTNDPPAPEWEGNYEYDRGGIDRGCYSDGYPKTDWNVDPRWEEAEWHRHVASVYNQGAREHMDEMFVKASEWRPFASTEDFFQAVRDVHSAHERNTQANYLELQIAQDAAKEYHSHNK